MSDNTNQIIQLNTGQIYIKVWKGYDLSVGNYNKKNFGFSAETIVDQGDEHQAIQELNKFVSDNCQIEYQNTMAQIENEIFNFLNK